MKKEFGKWLLDIAKYIATAVILTSVFGDMQEERLIYILASLAVIITLMLGLWFVKDREKGA